MDVFTKIIAIVATISLFLFSLQGFSKRLKKLGADRFNTWIRKVTQYRVSGFFLGALLTAIIQSSSAVSSITVALVDAGTITFRNSLPVLVGTNLGTTVTAWLVSFKLDFLGPLLLVVGTIIGLLPWRIHIVGRAVFYLGLILFSLDLISDSLEPIKESEAIIKYLQYAEIPVIGILLGALITAMVQSSSVTTGLAIILAGKGMIELNSAIALVVGANIGTTTTAILASLSMNRESKKAAMANFLFNLIGLLVFFPLLDWFTRIISKIPAELMYQVAFAHLGFNVVVSLIVLPLLRPIERLIKLIYRDKPEGQTELEFDEPN
jgi:phosphate:Na+ symporter